MDEDLARAQAAVFHALKVTNAAVEELAANDRYPLPIPIAMETLLGAVFADAYRRKLDEYDAREKGRIADKQLEALRNAPRPRVDLGMP